MIRHGGVRPWVHVDDATTATVAALEHGTSGSAYNVAADEPVSFSELMTAMAAALDALRRHVVPSWLLTAAPYVKAVMTGACASAPREPTKSWGGRRRCPPTATVSPSSPSTTAGRRREGHTGAGNARPTCRAPGDQEGHVAAAET